MHLHGAQADAQRLRQLLVRLAGHQPGQHLLLAGAELVDEEARAVAPAAFGEPLAEQLGRRGQAGEQGLLADRLFQELDRARLHRLDGGRDIALAGEHDHRPVDAAARHLLQRRQSVRAGHAQVEQDAARLQPIQRGQEIARIGEGMGGKVCILAQHAADHRAHAALVVDNVNDQLRIVVQEAIPMMCAGLPRSGLRRV